MRKHISTVIVVGLLLVAMIFAAGCTSSDNSPTPSVPSATRDPKFVPKNISGYRTSRTALWVSRYSTPLRGKRKMVQATRSLVLT